MLGHKSMLKIITLKVGLISSKMPNYKEHILMIITCYYCVSVII